jgi:putative ATP-dependent endonuclease of the OLD family
VLTNVRVRGFRAARDVAFAPTGLCALVGEANAGKSTLLAAVRALLEPGCDPTDPDDLPHGRPAPVTVEGTLASGATCRIDGIPPQLARLLPADAPEVVYLPAELRAGPLVAPAAGTSGSPARVLLEGTLSRAQAVHPMGASTTTAAGSLVEALEALADARSTGLVILIEEPELYLRPQAQRYLYRLLRALTAGGNQVIYSTHAPAFLNVARLEELVFVGHTGAAGIDVRQPAPIDLEHDFRVLTEFDAERSEVFLARAALLVEGATEKLVFPFVFRALGHDADREAITIVECGGKSNIPLFAQVCRAAGIPCVAVHDRDAPPGRRPIASERAMNHEILKVLGADRIIELAPDFERVTGLSGHRHKPERAWERFTDPGGPIPPPLERAVRLVLGLARD